jgi:hypothetical protein
MSGSYFKDNGIKNSRLLKNDFWNIYTKEGSENKDKSVSSNCDKSGHRLPPIKDNLLKKIQSSNLDEIRLKGSLIKIHNTNGNFMERRKEKNNSDDNGLDSKNNQIKFNKKKEISEKIKKILDSETNKTINNENDFNKMNNKVNIQEGSNKIILNGNNQPPVLIETKHTIDNDKNKHIIVNTNDLEDDFQYETNQEEVQNLIEFMNNLDFEKYLKDLHIREALHLIKNKIEKQMELEEVHKDSSEKLQKDAEIMNNKISQNTNIDSITNTLDANGENLSKSTLPVLIHEKPWDNSVLI